MSKFEKGQMVTYNDCRLSLHDIAKKVNCHHPSTDVFLKNYKKTGNYHQKEVCGYKRKTTASEETKIVKAAKWQCTTTS